MARDRRRAKQRQQRAQRSSEGRAAGGRAAHESVPGALEHASGEVAEFDAALVAGAQGQPSGLEADEPEGAELESVAVSGERSPAGPRAGGNRVANFLRASWAELQRVQWPDRRQVAQATGVVLGFVAIAGAYLGVADFVAQKLVDAIL